MKSLMTEKEFVEAIDNGCGTGWSKRISELVLPIVRSAGLEFAQEPVRLPECLVVNSSGGRRRAQSSNPGKAWCFELVEVSHDVAVAQGRMQEEREAVFDAAVDRYNAYPRLWAAAKALLGRLRALDIKGAHGHIGQLENELARGPKT